MQRDDLFSIVVPTFNRAQTSTVTVESLLAQDASVSYEIIVADNDSTDDTPARIHGLMGKAPGRLRYLLERRPGLSAARNAGVAAARGSIIAFIDDDAVAHPGWLEALAGTYCAYPDAWCVGGKIVLGLPAALPRWFDPGSAIMTAYLSGLDLGEAVVRREYPNDVWGANFSVRRSALDRVGRFDARLGALRSRLTLAEETEFCWRVQAAGGGVYYCGGAIVTHVVPKARLTKRYFRARAYWLGRTWKILDRPDVVVVHPGQFLHAAASGIVNRVRSFRAGAAQSRKAFEAELRFWFCAGFVYQQSLMAVTRHPRLPPSATQGTTPP